MCKLLLLGSTVGFVFLAGEQGAFAVASRSIDPQVEEATEEKSRGLASPSSEGSLLRRLWGYTPCPPIRPDCNRNTAVDIGDSLPGDFVVSKQTPFRTGRNEVLITSPSTGTEQRFEINLPDTGRFQLYKASFDKVKVSNPEKVLGAGASLSPQQVAAKLQNFEVEFEQNAPKTVVLADGTRGEFSAGGVVIRSKDGRVIETVGASAMRGRMRPRLMAAVPVGSDAVVAQAGGGSCQGSIRTQLYEMSQAVQKKGADILKQKATSEEAKLIAWVTTFSRQALEDSLIADNRNQTLQEVACAKPVQCNEPQNYSGGWETRTDLFKLPGTNNAISLRYEFYSIPDRIELWREGKLIFERGPKSGSETLEINDKRLHGAGFVGVKLIGNPTNKGTAWNYTISCSGEPETGVAVAGVFQQRGNGVPDCAEGMYEVEGRFNPDSKKVIIDSAPDAEACFGGTLPVAIFEAPGLGENSGPMPFTSPPELGLTGHVSSTGGGLLNASISHLNSHKSTSILDLNRLDLIQKTQGLTGVIKSISGNKNDLAIDNLPNKYIDDNFEVVSDKSNGVIRNVLEVALTDKATVGGLNLALKAAGAVIIESTPKVPVLMVAIPDVGTKRGIERAIATLETKDSILFTSVEPIYSREERPIREERPTVYQNENDILVARNNSKSWNSNELAPIHELSIVQKKQSPKITSGCVPPQATAKEAIPIPLLLSGAVIDFCGNLPIQPPHTSTNVGLFLLDSFAVVPNRDLNLKVSGIWSGKEHGFEVAGLMAGIRGNKFGTIGGVYPNSGEQVIGVDISTGNRFTSIPSKKRILEEIYSYLNNHRNGKAVINISSEEYTIFPIFNVVKEKAMTWMLRVRSLGLESNTIIAAALGNNGYDASRYDEEAGKSHTQINTYASAAILKDSSTPLEFYEECKYHYSIVTCSESTNKASKNGGNISWPLKNTIVVENVSSDGARYKAPPGESGSSNYIPAKDRARVNVVGAIGNVRNVDPRLNTVLANPPNCASGGFVVIHSNDKLACSFGGTSQASPQVAGLAAYIWKMNPNLSVTEVIQIIKDNQSEFPILDANGRFSVGPNTKKCQMSSAKIINVPASLKAALATSNPALASQVKPLSITCPFP